ncbi:hypothetical protein [Fusibacter sp. JL216-2]|uniref:hypothetical protein n=1 Tax=Fusibacter sp. JL216-2 TaxID=3071453 RepID=UPI003D33EBD2|tara:strand:- start:820 stop:1122 length:303 start_codon:yes stop_codon:yes gene_type:complete
MALDLILLVLGLIFGVHSIKVRKKLNFYNSYRIENVIDEKFYDLQLLFGLLSSLSLMLSGALSYSLEPPVQVVFLSILVFHIVNYIPIMIGSKLFYIEKK